MVRIITIAGYFDQTNNFDIFVVYVVRCSGFEDCSYAINYVLCFGPNDNLYAHAASKLKMGLLATNSNICPHDTFTMEIETQSSSIFG